VNGKHFENEALRKRSYKPEEIEKVGFAFLCGQNAFSKRSFLKTIFTITAEILERSLANFYCP